MRAVKQQHLKCVRKMDNMEKTLTADGSICLMPRCALGSLGKRMKGSPGAGILIPGGGKRGRNWFMSGSPGIDMERTMGGLGPRGWGMPPGIVEG